MKQGNRRKYVLSSFKLGNQSVIQKVRLHLYLLNVNVWIRSASLQGHQDRDPQNHRHYYHHHYHHLLPHHHRLHSHLHSRCFLLPCPHRFHPHYHYRKNLHFRHHHQRYLPYLIDILAETDLLHKDLTVEAVDLDTLLPQGLQYMDPDTLVDLDY
jgi:hypothetical protein